MDPVEAGATRPLALRVVHGPPEAIAAGPHLLVDRELRIGRAAEAGANLVVDDPTVSRVHAMLVRDGDAIVAVDCESSNGVFVNGRRETRVEVRAGDVVRLGDSILVVDHAPQPEEGATSDLGLAGTSAAIADIRSTVRRVAKSMLPVLLSGPTGTGKELVARALHESSGRRGAFVPVNCAALPSSLAESVLFGHKKGAFTGAAADQDGAFVQAHGGTLFLDEIGEMPLDEQPKLLRALETLEVVPLGAARAIPVDVRVVVATNVELPAALEGKRFRADLYARLAGLVLHTPPLEHRREDVLPLFRRFASAQDPSLAARPMTPDFAESLCLWSWPLNVRELRRLAERLSVLHPDAPRWERGMLDEPMHKPPALATPPVAVPAPLAASGAPGLEAEAPSALSGPPTREELLALLDQHGGNVSLVARQVGRNRKQVYRWMVQYDVVPGTGRAR